jgi:opacity protein-like surface antigen
MMVNAKCTDLCLSIIYYKINNMKILKSKDIQYALTGLLLIVFMSSSIAQRAEFGVRLMPTFTSFDLQTSSGGKVKGEATLGFGVGALLGFNFSRYIGVQGEVIYSAISQKYKEEDVERKVKLKYVNIPVLLSLNTGKTKIINLNVVAGPQLGISVGSRLFTSGNNSADSTTAVLSVKKGDLGFAYGAGIDFAVNEARTARLSLGYRGVFGLFDISDDNRSLTTDSYYVLDRTHIKTNAIYVGISILF